MPISNSSSSQSTVVTHDPIGCIVLSINGLSKAFGGVAVLDAVDAALREGEVILLRGDNGSGKTTLLNILTGNLEPDSGAIRLRTNGREETFRFPRKWWEGVNPFDHFTPERVAREGVGRSWQDVRLFPSLTLLDNIAVARQQQPAENPLRALVSRSASALESDNRRESAALLASLKLAGHEQSSGDKISLGQSKRVAIARAVQAGARILFLDEPLSGLDAAGIEEVLGLLTSLARNERLTLVIVEHTFNIPRVLKFASTVWHLRSGRIAVQTPAEARADYSSEATGAVKLISRHLGNSYQREDIPLYRGARLTRFFPVDSASNRTVLLEVRDLVVRRGSRLVVGHEDSLGKVSGLSFALREGDIAILEAPNGWGKSTFFSALCGLIGIDSGRLSLEGQPINDLPIWSRANRGLHALSSDQRGFPNLRGSEALALLSLECVEDEVSKIRQRKWSSLSGGQKQILGLNIQKRRSSASLVQLWDEPFTALDSAATALLIKGLPIQRNLGMLILTPTSPDNE